MTEPEAGTVSWAELLDHADTRVDKGDVRRIIEEITGARPGGLHRVLDDLATVRGVARFDDMIRRRAAGEPLQYVLGRWGFRTLDLLVDRRVLIPRPETEVVAGLAIELMTAPGAPVAPIAVDLGTGSGAIALSLAAECATARVFATDASADAVAVARANLAGIGRAATRVSLHEGSWFAALPAELESSCDVIVSNPPYIGDDEELPPVVAEWEPASALRSGPAGLADLHRIVHDVPRWLAPGGALVLEMAPQQTATVATWCADVGLEPSVHPDLAGRDRAVIGRKAPS